MIQSTFNFIRFESQIATAYPTPAKDLNESKYVSNFKLPNWAEPF